MRKRILIEIPEEDLRRDLGWYRQGMDEWAVRSYLVRHLDIIDRGLNIEHLIGFNIFFENQEADMLFNKNGVYYIIETKQKGKYYRGWKYLGDTVRCFEQEMKMHNEEPQEVIPILATSSKIIKELTVRSIPNWDFPTE